jgi:hypothetical protein
LVVKVKGELVKLGESFHQMLMFWRAAIDSDLFNVVSTNLSLEELPDTEHKGEGGRCSDLRHSPALLVTRNIGTFPTDTDSFAVLRVPDRYN